MPTYNTTTEATKNMMWNMYGPLGVAVSNVLGTRRGHPVYRVRVSDELELAVPSHEVFDVGDCVAVWVPASVGARHYFRLAEAGIEKTAGCE